MFGCGASEETKQDPPKLTRCLVRLLREARGESHALLPWPQVTRFLAASPNADEVVFKCDEVHHEYGAIRTEHSVETACFSYRVNWTE